VVFAGAPLDPTPRLRARIGALRSPRVIAADSGAATALAFDLRPDIVVGDFDSLDPATRLALESHNVPFERHPTAKDATDGQLALQHALLHQPSEILLLGYLNGPRLDMTVSTVLLLTLSAVRTTLLDERNEAILLRGPQRHVWSPEEDELISLLPLMGDCQGVRTDGLRFPLRGESLIVGDTRGVSNEALAGEVAVAFDEGVLLLCRHFARL
jgi:thiamine pyrophosphokinase